MRLELPAVLAILVIGSAVATLAGILGVRLLRRVLKPFLWRLRNRLLFSYLFSAVIPILLIVLFVTSSLSNLGGQVAVHLVQSELEGRIRTLDTVARGLTAAPEPLRGAILDRLSTFYEDRFPALEASFRDTPEPTPPRAGVLARGGALYVWSRASANGREVTLAAPITRRWLAALIPGIGNVSIIGRDSGGRRYRLHDVPEEGESDPTPVPQAVNRWDSELLWASEVTVDIEPQGIRERLLLSVHSRLSALLRILFRQETESPLPTLIYLFGVLFLMVQAASLYIGITLSRTMTGAVNELYEGTERVMEGHFSHRIPIRGEDQIAGLSRSFNRMTETVEQLVEVAREKERIETELEIARQVQQNLFPKDKPATRSLDLHAICIPARMVSGDYYDYQPMTGGGVVFAVGDVSGKGVAAALLMSTLQASLRMQLSEEEPPTVSQLMSRINRQLYASTPPEKYATLFLAIYDDATGLVRYSNGGHLPPILIRNGEATKLEVNGTIVGAFPAAGYGEDEIVLQTGDLLVGYTDGITEPENEYEEMFGEERLIDVLLKNAPAGPEAIAAAVRDSIRAFTGSDELQDDLTIVLARRL